MGKLYLGLVHYPVYNKRGDIVTTSVTNLDLHDIARLAATYDLCRYFIIQPQKEQQTIIKEILAFWQEGLGQQYNADRNEAFSKVAIADSLDTVLAEIGGAKIIVTDAKEYPYSMDYPTMRVKIDKSDDNFLLLFGTGWGLAHEVMERADYCLCPIKGANQYNHLSVRSAAAIIVDRLRGR